MGLLQLASVYTNDGQETYVGSQKALAVRLTEAVGCCCFRKVHECSQFAFCMQLVDVVDHPILSIGLLSVVLPFRI